MASPPNTVASKFFAAVAEALKTRGTKRSEESGAPSGIAVQILRAGYDELARLEVAVGRFCAADAVEPRNRAEARAAWPNYLALQRQVTAMQSQTLASHLLTPHELEAMKRLAWSKATKVTQATTEGKSPSAPPSVSATKSAKPAWLRPPMPKASRLSASARAHNAAVIDRAMEAVGISPAMKSDPRQICSVLSDMRLLDFDTGYPPVRDMLSAAKERPQSMAVMLAIIKESLSSDHPAVIEFLDKALSENWLGGETIQRAVHVAYVLETLTAGMANNQEFATEIQDHLLVKRREAGISTSSSVLSFMQIVQKVGSFFLAAKIGSIDPLMTRMRHLRSNHGKVPSSEFVEALYDADKITYIEKRALTANDPKEKHVPYLGLQINIYEAGVAEYLKGFAKNAKTAFVLALASAQNHIEEKLQQGGVTPIYGPTKLDQQMAERDNELPVYPFSQDWVSLYTTWNMSFVVSEFEDLEVFMPKLFVPSVLSAEPQNYLTTRAFALWLSLNHLLFRRLDGIEASPGPDNRKEICRAWGEINQRHALKYASSELNQSPEELDANFEEWFGTLPRLKLAQLMAAF